jgi:hypothetical protein
MDIKIRVDGEDEDEGSIRLKGEWLDRNFFFHSDDMPETCSVMWTKFENGKPVASTNRIPYSRYENEEPRLWFKLWKCRRGDPKLLRKLERLWGDYQSKNLPPDEDEDEDEADQGEEPREQPKAKTKGGKASDTAAIFQSTNPKYSVKLFLTVSKKYPGCVNLHVVLNPGGHRFFTVRFEEAIREAEKLLTQLRQFSTAEK